MYDDIGEMYDISKVFEWRISNFFSLYGTRNGFFTSPSFQYSDNSDWFFQIQENSSSVENTAGYIDLYLCRDSDYFAINLDLSVSVKSIHGDNEFENHSKAIFNAEVVNHCVERFISRAQLIEKKTEYLPSDVLTIVCTMKTQVSTENASDNSVEECGHCKRNFNSEIISFHRRKCMERLIKCPDCLDDVVLQKWFYDHECQNKRTGDIISLSEDFQKILENGINHDVILRVGDKELSAHQDILRARSKVFESMLSDDFKEKDSGVINIPDCDPKAVEQFLFYIYSGKVSKLDESNMLKIYYVADKYDMNGLKEICQHFIRNSISSVNFCEVIELAINHSDSSLLEHATEYFIDNVLDIMHTVEWQIFMKENSTIANELTIKSIKKLKNF